MKRHVDALRQGELHSHVALGICHKLRHEESSLVEVSAQAAVRGIVGSGFFCCRHNSLCIDDCCLIKSGSFFHGLSGNNLFGTENLTARGITTYIKGANGKLSSSHGFFLI